MKRSGFFRSSFALSAIAAALLFSGEASGISLSEAREEALKANLKLRFFQEKAVEAGFKRQESYAGFFPTLSASAYASHKEPEPHLNIRKGEYGTFGGGVGPIPADDRTVFNGEQDTYGVALRLEQPVFAGGKILYTYRRAQAGEESAGHDEKQAAEDLLYATEEAYIGLLKAGELKRTAEQHLKTVQAHLKDMQLLHDRGRASKNDLLKVKVESARASEGLITADNDYLVAAGKLNIILNRPYNAEISAEPLPETGGPDINTADAGRVAFENRPDMKGAFGRSRAALYERKASESGSYPGVKFVTEYIHQTEQPTTDEDQWTAMLLLEYTIWDWGGNKRGVDAAKSVERQKQLEMLNLENDIYSEVHEALLSLKAAEKRIEVTKEALTQADENLRVTRFGFEHGARTSTDVLDAEDLKTRTDAEYIKARYDSFHARAALRHAMGLMMDADALAGLEEPATGK